MKRIFILLVALGMVFLTATPAFAAGDPTLTEEETASLLYMFEEEKLARDVYNLWEQQIFLKIATSEQTHMDAIQTLLERYGVTVPSVVPGVFTDPNLADLYTSLKDDSSLKFVDALNVGVTIETKEIDALEAYLEDGNITRKDIEQVYSHLLNASEKHLRSFNKVLSKLDVEGDELILLGAALFDGNGNGNGYHKSFETKGQSQTQTQTQNQYQDQTQNQYQYQDQTQDQYQYQDQSQTQNQTQDQYQYQDQTQSQAGNGDGSGDCNSDCGCNGTCDGSGSQNGKP